MIDKNAIKREYKQTIQPMGVYQIKNLVNGKIFVGYSTNVPARINRHKFAIEMGIEEIKELAAEEKQFGAENFSFEVLDLLEPKKDSPGYDYKDDLKTLYELWLEKLQPYEERGYNERVLP